MTPEDKNDIIKKINDAGEDAGEAPKDDFGDDIGSNAETNGDDSGEDFDNPLGENTVFPAIDKENKQVFKNAKLGVDEIDETKDNLTESCWKGYKQVGMKEKDGKQVPNCVPINENFDKSEKNSTFAENEDMTETVEPLVEPKTVPIVKPNVQPKRREKPWKITPNTTPAPAKFDK